jgi:hypothetical protein
MRHYAPAFAQNLHLPVLRRAGPAFAQNLHLPVLRQAGPPSDRIYIHPCFGGQARDTPQAIIVRVNCFTEPALDRP